MLGGHFLDEPLASGGQNGVVVMVNIVPVDSERHKGKGWRCQTAYGFAATEALVPLVGVDFARAAIAMPIAFIEQSGRYLPVAVMSPVQGRNFFVAPNGQWLGSYVPAALRSYPFSLGRVEGSDRVVLCIDEDSGWVIDSGVNADVTKFFEEDGSPSAATKATLDFLQQVERGRSITDLAVAALTEARVILPWPLTVQDGNQQVQINGLYRIDEAALNALDNETFLKLRRASALVIAQMQLISMQTIGVFTQLQAVRRQLAQNAQPLPPISSLFSMDDGGTIRFN
jgi:hypothetical protein